MTTSDSLARRAGSIDPKVTEVDPSHAEVSADQSRRGSLIRGVLGVSFEYYDFVVYAAFAPYFSRLFFPQDSPLAASLNTLAIFAIGFLARPVGAMLAGRLADRFGRRPVMLAALALVVAVPGIALWLPRSMGML